MGHACKGFMGGQLREGKERAKPGVSAGAGSQIHLGEGAAGGGQRSRLVGKRLKQEGRGRPGSEKGSGDGESNQGGQGC